MVKKELFNFYNIDILSVYQNNPDKFEVYTDNFEGRISIRDDYFATLLPENRIYLNIQFGFRTKKDGELALAVYLPDLKKSTSDEQTKWHGFLIKDYSIFEQDDERFHLFFNRYISCDWEIENGVLSKIKSVVSEINALTEMTLSNSLFKNEDDVYLIFPSAENDHKYQDAHVRVYGFLIDGLQKETIKEIAKSNNIKLHIDSDKTIDALEKILPKELHNDIIKPFRKVSKKRGPATHNTRKPAIKFPAFSKFNTDMNEIFKSLKLLKAFIENTTNISAEVCMKRKNRLEMLPKFDLDREKEIQPNYSISKFNEIVGKTIEKVEFGFQKIKEHHPNNELAFLHFADGSIISISIVSNSIQLCETNIQDFAKCLSLKFYLNFVPPLIKNNLEDKK